MTIKLDSTSLVILLYSGHTLYKVSKTIQYQFSYILHKYTIHSTICGNIKKKWNCDHNLGLYIFFTSLVHITLLYALITLFWTHYIIFPIPLSQKLEEIRKKPKYIFFGIIWIFVFLCALCTECLISLIFNVTSCTFLHFIIY